MIAIVDYGAGNVTSVRRAVEYVGGKCVVTSDPAVVDSADRIIVPGVGHFGATAAFSKNGLGAALERQMRAGRPVLGICLGMQWMFESSEEAPGVFGLGTFRGRCQRLPVDVKSPHVGWNHLSITGDASLLKGVPSGACVYFTHSFCAPLVEDTVASCEYGVRFSAAVQRGNLFGVQFHPEKSGRAGLKVLENFCSC